MVQKILVILSFLFVSVFTKAQTDTYFVFFKDKGGQTYMPSECLSQRAIDRYNQNNVVFSYEDYKVYPAYIDSISNYASVSYSSKWNNGVIATITDANLSQIKSFPFVDSVAFIGQVASSARLTENNKAREENRSLLSTNEEIRIRKELLGIDELEENQYDGDGVWVAVIDAGFQGVNTLDQFKHLFTDAKIIETFDVLTGEEDVYRYHDHGTNCLGSIAGINDAINLGASPRSSVGLYVTEDVNREQPIEMYWWGVTMERIDSIGYDVVSSSLGYIDFDLPFTSPSYADFDGKTLAISKSATIAGTKGLIVVTSIGNEGDKSWKYLLAPADAYNVISVGAVDAINSDIGAFSSFGPTADGRIKPEVCGVGVNTNVISKNGSVNPTNGTSYSAPQIAGVMAVLKQRYPLYTREQLTNVLFESSSQFSNPDNQYGFGVPNVADVVLPIQEERESQESFFNHKYEVYDISGKQINQVYSDLPIGIYIIRYFIEGNYFVEKVVKL